jgi:hypothetical protein
VDNNTPLMTLDLPLKLQGRAEIQNLTAAVRAAISIPPKTPGRKTKVQQIAKQFGVSYATICRGEKKVRSGKPLRKESWNHGVPFPGVGYVRSGDPAAIRALLEEITANTHDRLTVTTIHSRLRKAAGGCKMPAYRTACAIHHKLDSRIKALRDGGMRKVHEDVLPAIERRPDSYRVHEMLCLDQHSFDTLSVDDISGEIVASEPYLCADMRSMRTYMALGGPNYNRFVVTQSVRHAIEAGGLFAGPSRWYMDNGLPEKSKEVNRVAFEISQLGYDLSVVHALPYHGQSKPIEVINGMLDSILIQRNLPGLVKRLPDSRDNKVRADLLKEQIRNKKLLSTSELTKELFSAVAEWNSHIFKSRGEDSGFSPNDIYKNEAAKSPLITLSDEMLNYIFLPGFERKVRKSTVHVKDSWLPRALKYYHPELSRLNGDTVLVKWNPLDRRCVFIFKDRKLVCVAEHWAAIDAQDHSAVADKIALQRHLGKEIRDLYAGYKPAIKNKIRAIHPRHREARQMREAQEEQARKLEVNKERRSAVGAGQHDIFEKLMEDQYSSEAPRTKQKSSSMNFLWEDNYD